MSIAKGQFKKYLQEIIEEGRLPLKMFVAKYLLDYEDNFGLEISFIVDCFEDEREYYQGDPPCMFAIEEYGKHKFLKDHYEELEKIYENKRPAEAFEQLGCFGLIGALCLFGIKEQAQEIIRDFKEIIFT